MDELILDDPIYFRGRVLRWAILSVAFLLIVVPRLMAFRRRGNFGSGSEKPTYNKILYLGFVLYLCINAVALLMEHNGALMGSDVYGIFTDLCPWLLTYVVFVNQMGVRRRPFSWLAVACFIILMSLVGRISGYLLGVHSAAAWGMEIFLMSWIVSGSIGGCIVAGKGFSVVAGIILAPLMGPLLLPIALLLPTISKDASSKAAEIPGTQ